MVQWFLEGGSIMWFILILSVLSWIFIFEKAMVLFAEYHRVYSLRKDIEKTEFSPENLSVVLEDKKGSFAKVLRKIVENRNLRKEDNIVITRSQLKEETEMLQKGLTILDIATNTGPLLGLLGTVLGIVQVFAATAKVGLGNPLALSQGISVALNTTVFGLITAIPASIALSFYERRIENLLRLIDKYAALALTEFYKKG